MKLTERKREAEIHHNGDPKEAHLPIYISGYRCLAPIRMGGTLLGGPNNKEYMIYSMAGSILESPISGNYQIFIRCKPGT